jgi:acylphosphatase
VAATRVRVLVAGFVQGVSFRWYTADRARQGGVSGWVRNLPDGRVEAVFEGAPDAVASMVDWCRAGPRHAEVSHLEEITDEPPEGLRGFEVRL